MHRYIHEHKKHKVHPRCGKPSPQHSSLHAEKSVPRLGMCSCAAAKRHGLQTDPFLPAESFGEAQRLLPFGFQLQSPPHRQSRQGSQGAQWHSEAGERTGPPQRKRLAQRLCATPGPRCVSGLSRHACSMASEDGTGRTGSADQQGCPCAKSMLKGILFEG